MAEAVVAKKKNDYITSVGRRKEAIARIRLIKDFKEVSVNGKPYTEYFSSQINQKRVILPFELTETLKEYGATVLVAGGGMSAQVDAVVHGLARAFSKLDTEKYRKTLKVAGLLTRDPRAKERRKFGLAGKARAKKQSPKR
ncbi:MAG: 30S ribosomal protein S9 [Candidatus Daviesbacteria bacterium]|nr:30S ribosomal protein S9 [Candidatus Daviesbacteria bacterium]